MENQMRRRHDIMSILAAVLLTGCSAQPTTCDSLIVENIWFNELESRYPIKVGTNVEAKNWVERNQFQTKCLYLQRPEFKAGMDYFETRQSRDGDRVFLFTPAAATDTLVGFVILENDVQIVVVGTL